MLGRTSRGSTTLASATRRPDFGPIPEPSFKRLTPHPHWRKQTAVIVKHVNYPKDNEYGPLPTLRGRPARRVAQRPSHGYSLWAMGDLHECGIPTRFGIPPEWAQEAQASPARGGGWPTTLGSQGRSSPALKTQIFLPSLGPTVQRARGRATPTIGGRRRRRPPHTGGSLPRTCPTAPALCAALRSPDASA